MDRFFPEKLLGEVFWGEPLPEANQSDFLQYSELPKIGFGQQSSHNGSDSQNMKDDQRHPPANQSAFVQYRDLPRIGFGEESSQNGSNSQNMSKRMIEFLRSWPVERTKVAEYERERCFRHKINERMRRQRQRECYLALHSILPYGTKTNNNSVIQMAAKEIQRLQGCKDELQSKNLVLEAAAESNKVWGNKVQLRVPYPTSGIDSMVETLKCLKVLGVNTRSIEANFSQEELFAVLGIETKIADAEVERAIQRTVDEVEWKLHSDVWEGSKRQRTPKMNTMYVRKGNTGGWVN